MRKKEDFLFKGGGAVHQNLLGNSNLHLEGEVLAGVRPGPGGLVNDQTLQEQEKDDESGEKTTARFLGEVFNSLMKGIVFTTETVGDFPEDFGLPTLDTCR